MNIRSFCLLSESKICLSVGCFGQGLADVITSCLKEAEKLRLTSLSFPAIGTGNLSFPRQVVARVLLRQIQLFSRRVSPRHLKDVVIVVHHSDRQTTEVRRPFCRAASGNGAAAKTQHVLFFSVSPESSAVRRGTSSMEETVLTGTGLPLRRCPAGHSRPPVGRTSLLFVCRSYSYFAYYGLDCSCTQMGKNEGKHSLPERVLHDENNKQET